MISLIIDKLMQDNSQAAEHLSDVDKLAPYFSIVVCQDLILAWNLSGW